MGKRRASGEGALFFNESKDLWVGRYTENGKRKEIAAKTQAKALRKLNEAKAAVARSLPVPNDRLKVGPFFEQWLEDEVRPRRAFLTHRAYVVDVRRHIVPQLGGVALARLTPQEVQRLLVTLEHQGLSPATIKHVHGTLRTALHLALRWGIVQRDVASLVRGPRQDQREVQPLEPAETQALLGAMRGHRLEALYCAALGLGLRLGEALGLRWEDIDFDDGRLQVVNQLQDEGKERVLKALKTTRSRRVIELPDLVVEKLKAHRALQNQERLLAGSVWEDKWGLVFTTQTGRPQCRRAVQGTFHRLRKKAGLDHQRFHDLRHACASLLLAQGVELHEVSAILGHAGIQITANIYGHLYQKRRREIANVMDAVLRPAR